MTTLFAWQPPCVKRTAIGPSVRNWITPVQHGQWWPKGEVYRGLALLFGKRYITQYQPVKDAGGQVIAIIFVGVDITHSWNVMREKILSRRLGESGHFFVLDRSNGKNHGQYLFHSAEEGRLPTWENEVQQQLLGDDSGTLERQSADGRTLIMAWTPLPGWNWTIVGEVDKTVLLADVTSMRDRFLLAGVVLSALFAMLFVFIIRRWLTRPLRDVIWSGRTVCRRRSARHSASHPSG
ncbi:Uncharacterised protein [Leclercia adecarboxylata]|uniref:Cache 3/Cache 2 fusion domain-containing protein n=1 Tax=Leclercia adecarboxylata TaxID=83655 RepID=A0A4U9HKY9_9ENTR|nr:Uncharacterised protein [Leclercia adecarboxylata]